jgi:hypothetical protein
MTRRFSRFLPFFALFLLAFPAMAQDAGNADGVPEFIPAAGWTVGPSGIEAVRGLKGTKLPCVMAGEFNNGFVVRFSGGNREMLAMAVDFRQDVFRQGGRYAATLSVDGGIPAELQGSAFTPSILVFNLRETGGVYNALMGGRAMELAVGTNKMRFYLNNITEGLQKLEACFAGGPGIAAAPAQTAMNEDPLAMPEVSAPPTSLSEIQSAPADAPDWEAGAKDTPIGPEVYIRRDGTREAAPARNMAAAMKAGADTNAAGMKRVWKADAGESIKDVMARWSEEAGMALKWEAGQGGQVAEDFRMSGTVNDAVAALMAKNTDGAKLSGYTQTSEGRAPVASKAPYDGVSSSPRYSAGSSAGAYAAAPQSSGGMAGARASSGGYGAAAGASLQNVLAQWCAQNNVQFIWNGVYNYPLKSAVSNAGSFEAAVTAALSQYQGADQRPVGRLNTDPSTGRRLLVIDTEFGG